MKALGEWRLKTHKKLFELDEEINGCKYALVSVKLDGIDNLSASVFIWPTNSSKPNFKIKKEIWFDSGKESYNHETELKKALEARNE